MKYLADTVTLQYQPELCTRCGRCVEVCPRGVFVLAQKTAEITDRDLCIECGACARNCPAAALEVQAGVGCAEAVINGLLRGGEPACGCADDSACGDSSVPRADSCCGGGSVSETAPDSCCGGSSAEDAPACGCSTGASPRGCC
jgi:NAD-dependent dihydropyrimidine dehydrogenase PreA subunit